ncbi:hypothetical protein HO133_010897 [Letharia lupina]|uniref:PCI domain-containing protein n=1 Tax=Letharia lupina TaxID=560253 RepID=A0A8H6CJ52_9LECA|nr:uncharacterized protein HO133_010897 [Letharia lupina]KAF6224320.1 hypothetical protein HO133_010897 [Letharia lupina]
MSPPTLDQFLGEIAGIIKEKNGTQLQEYLIYEPPLPPLYNKIVSEIKQFYPTNSQKALENKCISFIPEYDEGDDGGSRTSFVMFMVKYFTFLRDVNVDNLIETHDLLKALLNQSILALSSSIGVIVLPTVVSLSHTLARLAIGLDKRPELIEHLIKRESVVENEATERVTLVESSANVIREAFKKCLSERSGPPSGVDSNGKPEGRRVGIYLMANLCLKLFFHCRKLRSAEQIFGNIYQQSPPLGLFPAAQRVTFLYYLGRYLFANNHFYRAQLALQTAYDQCHAQCISQRRLIFIYLTTSNIILGRFPSSRLLQRPEAAGLAEKFQPICAAIAKGDLASFRKYMDLDAQHAEWFLQKRILLQLSNRCEVLVWRSLARRTFTLSGSQGAVTSQGDVTRKAAPTLSLQDMLTLATLLEKRVLGFAEDTPKSNGLTNGHTGTQRTHTNAIFVFPKAQTPPPQEADAELPYSYVDPDLADVVDPEPPLLPNMEIIESIVASLIEQGLLHGFISHAQHRFAITGVKDARPVQVGFPRVWDVIKARANKEVPGWVKERKAPAFGPGMVVNLSGARPAGAAPG